MFKRPIHRGQLIGMQLRALREKAEISLDEVAGHFGVRPQTVLNWEMGRAIPNVDRLSELADLYHVPLDSLIDNCRAGANSFDHRYIVIRADGESDNLQTRYMVLTPDTDPLARKALEVYAAGIRKSNPHLSAEIYDWLESFHRS